MLLREQLFRFREFGKTMLRLELSDHGCEHFGCRACSAICLVQVGKFKRTAQLEGLRLLVSRDFQRSLEIVYGTGFVRKTMARQKPSADTMQLGIKPMLTGLCGPGDHVAQDFQPCFDLANLCIRHGDMYPPKWLAEIAIVLVQQSPAVTHVRQSGHSVAGTPLGQAIQVGARGHIQRHRVVARETERQDRLRLLQHAPAYPIEHGAMNQRIGPGKRPCLPRSAHRFGGDLHARAVLPSGQSTRARNLMITNGRSSAEALKVAGSGSAP